MKWEGAHKVCLERRAQQRRVGNKCLLLLWLSYPWMNGFVDVVKGSHSTRERERGCQGNPQAIRCRRMELLTMEMWECEDHAFQGRQRGLLSDLC